MRLELRQINGNFVKDGAPKWFFEHGRRTLGRAGDCDWQMSDPECHVSKHHCTIERDREGFLLRDQSANGSRVDGMLLLEGQSARLNDQSRIAVGGLTFSVHISGDNNLEFEDPDASLRLSDETLTVSSILADIAPGGRTATGILGERANDAWLPQADLAATKRNGTSSRDVEIGWSGPPQVEGLAAILPNDWNSDAGYSSELEHGAATRIAVHLRQNRPAAEAEETTEEITGETRAAENAEEIDRAFGALAASPPLGMPALEGLVRQLEEASEGTLSIFEIEAAEIGDGTSFITGEDAALSARLESLLQRQLVLNAALEKLVRAASHMLEPRIVEARIDAEPNRQPWQRKRNYWQAYRTQFERSGRSLSIRELFREAMVGPSGSAGQDSQPMTGRIDRAS
ncbi:FHA domain-containing protein [Rhizobium mongolense]|uniref:Type VI secretion system protein ImpI n=1 Tax=Rhizobium mongolense TaxID=57676 RepID=A0A7W6WEY4_9HYPH|nr:FHA domain-containing protein [Rhizobium mongolense]MBB4275616.1 type VI secretion system protein ImpI [Rhizobium mongolense]